MIAQSETVTVRLDSLAGVRLGQSIRHTRPTRSCLAGEAIADRAVSHEPERQRVRDAIQSPKKS